MIGDFTTFRSSLIVQRSFYKKTNINMSPRHKQKIFNNYNNFCLFSAPSTKFSKKSAHLNTRMKGFNVSKLQACRWRADGVHFFKIEKLLAEAHQHVKN